MRNRIREIRLAQGISGLTLASMTRIAQGDISKLERGLLFLHPGWRRRIAEALRVDEAALEAEGAVTVANQEETARSAKPGGLP